MLVCMCVYACVCECVLLWACMLTFVCLLALGSKCVCVCVCSCACACARSGLPVCELSGSAVCIYVCLQGVPSSKA